MTEIPQFLYKIQPTRVEMLREGLTEEEAEIIASHFEYLSDLREQDILILAGRTLNTDESSFGIVIFNAESEERAREIMHGDPAVHLGVMGAALYPFRVALMANR
jgi:uncharacterized protein YciI